MSGAKNCLEAPAVTGEGLGCKGKGKAAAYPFSCSVGTSAEVLAEHWLQELVAERVNHSPVFIAGDESKNIQLKF